MTNLILDIMRKKLLLFCFFFVPVCAFAVETNLIAITADGETSYYQMDAVRNIVIDDSGEGENVLFALNLKSGESISDVKEFSFGVPTGVEESESEGIGVDAKVFTKEKTIYVECEKECEISFYNFSGQLLGKSVVAKECECVVTLTGLYLVRAGGKDFKILVD